MKYSPMLCHLGNKDWTNKKGYFFELKLDGVRLILYKNNKIELINKKGISKSEQYPELLALGRFLKPKSCVLDGEIIVYNENGVPDFHMLMKRDHVSSRLAAEIRAQKFPAVYVAFDILEIDGKPLLKTPLAERRKILSRSIRENENLELVFSTEKGNDLWKEIQKRNLEGVIAKKASSLYHPGQRTWDWVKIKNLNTIDVVIVGYTTQKRHISSLCMALYKNNKLTFIGKVGTGFTEKMLDELGLKFENIKTSKPSVINPPEGKINWLKPLLVAEIEFLSVTENEQLRSPSLKRFRDDKHAKECTWEEQVS